MVFFGSLTLFLFMAALVIADSHNAALTGQSAIFSLSGIINVFSGYFGFFGRFYHVAAGPCIRAMMQLSVSALRTLSVTFFTLTGKAARLAIELFNLI